MLRCGLLNKSILVELSKLRTAIREDPTGEGKGRGKLLPRDWRRMVWNEVTVARHLHALRSRAWGISVGDDQS